MELYNTLTRQLDEINPKAPSNAATGKQKITVYTCGPTVYDYAHIGHWFNYVRMDMLVRTLKIAGFEPDWVMNITDVGHLVSDADEGEDKLEKGARREGKTAWQVADFYTRDFLAGMQALRIQTPGQVVKATEHIAEQIALIQRLEAKGFSYVIDDGVYFDTSKFPAYADFARLDLDEQQTGARIAFNKQKRNTTDFALWKFSPRGRKRDMQWWAPWQYTASPDVANGTGNSGGEQHPLGWREGKPETGEKIAGSWGFPGWHIECSAMSMKYLGETIDIHTGGIDHIPVHHTNEIAQSEAATGKPFVRHWMHSNHVTVDGEKISKSLGNGIRLQEITARDISPMAVRLHILESHYRSQSKFSWESLEAAQNRLKKYQAFADLAWQGKDIPARKSTTFTDTKSELADAMLHDLNSPRALAILSGFADTIDTLSQANINNLVDFLRFLDALFGLSLVGESRDITPAQKQLIAEREAARTAKEWADSDKFRNELAEQGIGLRDTTHGAIWHRL